MIDLTVIWCREFLVPAKLVEGPDILPPNSDVVTYLMQVANHVRQYLNFDLNTIQPQFLLFRDRLRAGHQGVYRPYWYDAGDAALHIPPKLVTRLVYKSFLTDPALYTGCESFLWFFAQMATKVSTESVVESMSKIVKKHGDPVREPDHPTIEKESCIDWNTPSAYTNKSDQLIDETMDRCGFTCERSGDRRNATWAVSKVVDKHAREPAKFPFLVNW